MFGHHLGFLVLAGFGGDGAGDGVVVDYDGGGLRVSKVSAGLAGSFEEADVAP